MWGSIYLYVLYTLGKIKYKRNPTRRPVWSLFNGNPTSILSCRDVTTVGNSSGGILEYLYSYSTTNTSRILSEMKAG